MKSIFVEAVEDSPVIAAVKDMTGLEKSLSCDSQIVFILFGDIMNIADIVNEVKKSGRIAMVHIDLVHGLNSREISVDFIHKNTKADGIISTKPMLIKRAKELGMYTVMRFFLLDSMALDNISNQCRQVRPDCMEVLPGVMPKVIGRIVKKERIPVIAGGLISDKEDILNSLDAGAIALSSTNPDIWFL